jgi:SM-20-related protein
LILFLNLPHDDQSRILNNNNNNNNDNKNTSITDQADAELERERAVSAFEPMAITSPINVDSNLTFTSLRLARLNDPSARHFLLDDYLAAVSANVSLSAILVDANALFLAGKLRRAGMAQRDRGAAPMVESTLRGDSLIWLDDATLRDVDALRAAVDAMRASVAELALSCGFVAARTTVQLARYPRGARYVRHLDATAVHASARRLTLLLYLNPDWTEADGGQLRLFVPEQAPLDIAPIANRLLVFHSHGVPHEVLESHADARYSLTLWAYGGVTETAPTPTQTPSTES